MRTFQAFTGFSSLALFNEAPMNVFCNQLFTTVLNVVTEKTISDKLVLDGEVALLLQDYPTTVSKVLFSTASKSIFQLILTSASCLSISGFERKGNSIIMIVGDRVVEVRLVNAPMNLIPYGGLFLNKKSDILNENN